MQRKKAENPEITVLDGNLKDSYLVQKSEPLLLMRSVPFNLGELKILDTYLSRINSHDEKCRTVTFTKSEYEQLMEIGKTNITTLKKYTERMLGKVVEVPMPNKGYMQFVLFTSAKCELNEFGERVIELTCSEEAKQLFFGIEQLGYLQYEMKNILSLTSKYSFLLYLYLRKERYRANWVVPLSELREQRLDIKNNETYANFKYFKRDILDKAVAEINEKTDIKFSYSTVKSGRRITGIQFQLIKELKPQVELPELPELPDKDQMSLFDEDSPEEAPEYGNEKMSLLAEACNNEFSAEEMTVIFSIISSASLPQNELGIDIARYHYLASKYAELNLQANRRKITSRFSYLKRIIENDLKG